MHLRAFDKLPGSEAEPSVKFWLEDRGRRTCELAAGKIEDAARSVLEQEVGTCRQWLECSWVMYMVESAWLTAKREGSEILLTAYPGHCNAFTRLIDLRRLFPGAYEGPQNWYERPPSVDFDLTNGLLAVGCEENIDNRNHIDTTEHLFRD